MGLPVDGGSTDFPGRARKGSVVAQSFVPGMRTDTVRIKDGRATPTSGYRASLCKRMDVRLQTKCGQELAGRRIAMAHSMRYPPKRCGGLRG